MGTLIYQKIEQQNPMGLWNFPRESELNFKSKLEMLPTDFLSAGKMQVENTNYYKL